eukprot:4882650-Prymnesium_polylepis.1
MHDDQHRREHDVRKQADDDAHDAERVGDEASIAGQQQPLPQRGHLPVEDLGTIPAVCEDGGEPSAAVRAVNGLYLFSSRPRVFC